MRTTALALLVALTAVLGCDDPEPPTWVEVRCAADSGRCTGLPADTADAWVFLTSADTLAERLDAGDYLEIEGWSTDVGCALGETPDSDMPETVCVWIPSGARSQCFIGGDGWFALAHPRCTLADPVGPAWDAELCDGEAGEVGTHPWESIACDGATSCRAALGNATVGVLPTCWVDEQG